MADDRWNSARYAREKRSFIDSRLLHRWVNLHVGVIFTVTWATGWLVSALLLWFGMDSMPLRYAIGFAMSYPVFFLCVRVWADFMRQERGANDSDGEGYAFDVLGGGGEGCLVVLAVLAVAVLVAAVLSLTGGAGLMLEVAFEVVFAGTLVTRLGRVDEVGHWAKALWHRTWLPAIMALLALIALAGWLQHMAPRAQTFGQAVRHISAQYIESR